MTTDPIHEGALALPEADRAELAAALLTSLGPEPESDQSAVDEAWASELDRRAAALDSGDDPGVPLVDALSEAREHLTR